MQTTINSEASAAAWLLNACRLGRRFAKDADAAGFFLQQERKLEQQVAKLQPAPAVPREEAHA